MPPYDYTRLLADLQASGMPRPSPHLLALQALPHVRQDSPGLTLEDVMQDVQRFLGGGRSSPAVSQAAQQPAEQPAAGGPPLDAFLGLPLPIQRALHQQSGEAQGMAQPSELPELGIGETGSMGVSPNSFSEGHTIGQTASNALSGLDTLGGIIGQVGPALGLPGLAVAGPLSAVAGFGPAVEGGLSAVTGGRLGTTVANAARGFLGMPNLPNPTPFNEGIQFRGGPLPTPAAPDPSPDPSGMSGPVGPGSSSSGVPGAADNAPSGDAPSDGGAPGGGIGGGVGPGSSSDGVPGSADNGKLATWALRRRGESPSMKGFLDFKTRLAKRSPERAVDFDNYAAMAEGLVNQIEGRPASEQKRAEQMILRRAVRPAGKRVDQNEVGPTFDRLQQVAADLDRRYGAAY